MLQLIRSSRRDDDPAYGWVVVGALGVTETVSYGVLGYAFGVLIIPMHRSTGWSIPELTGAYSLSLLVSGIAAKEVGRILDRGSVRLLMTSGSLLAGLLVLAWSRAGNLAELYLIFASLGVAMALVLYEPAFIVVTKWFERRRHAALTTLTLIAALASFIFSPLTEWLVSGHGWRFTVLTLGVVLIGITVPIHALVLRRPPASHATKEVVRLFRSRRGQQDPPLRRSFRLIVASFAFSSFVSAAIAVLLVPLLLSGGAGARFAALAAGLMGIAQIPGRLLFALCGRQLGTAGNAALVFVIGALSLCALELVRSGPAALIAVTGLGVSNGMATLLRATLVGDLYGRDRFGAISGRVNVYALGARAAAPFVAALIVLAPGGYRTLLGVLAGFSILAALSAWRGIQRETLRVAESRELAAAS